MNKNKRIDAEAAFTGLEAAVMKLLKTVRQSKRDVIRLNQMTPEIQVFLETQRDAADKMEQSVRSWFDGSEIAKHVVAKSADMYRRAYFQGRDAVLKKPFSTPNNPYPASDDLELHAARHGWNKGAQDVSLALLCVKSRESSEPTDTRLP